MTLKDLRNKKIAILGLGVENQAMLEFLLRKNVQAYYTVCDSREYQELCDRCDPIKKNSEQKKIKLVWKFGKNYDKGLDEYDIIFRIAGYPLFTPQIIKAMVKGVTISSATKLCLELAPTKNIIGVTGSKGKGTTASLLYDILKTAGKSVHFGGNIGVPIFSFFEKIQPNDWLILELSSFQLEDLNISPRIAVMTNFFPEHLAAADPLNPNFHKNLDMYWHAKTNIFTHQKKGDTLIANKNLRRKIEAYHPKGKIHYFKTSDLETPLIGQHNQKNIAAAEMAAKLIGIKQSDIAKSVKTFKGLEHRLELAGVKNNIRYYNDSFSTNPEACITALKAFGKNQVILIAGGASVNADFSALAQQITRQTKQVILLPGEGSKKILSALKKLHYHHASKAQNMTQAVASADENAKPGDVVLLSPACKSFGLFKNAKERGDRFKAAVKSK
ncbi:MAG: UDP-N-acetylmuramoyl-L-alanine--D-glutamate ligase [bacterium]|nr:UDP-N-acetylmuramoyl-L-alanine--D-glutamate ligase [bacterium]